MVNPLLSTPICRYSRFYIICALSSTSSGSFDATKSFIELSELASSLKTLIGDGDNIFSYEFTFDEFLRGEQIFTLF